MPKIGLSSKYPPRHQAPSPPSSPCPPTSGATSPRPAASAPRTSPSATLIHMAIVSHDAAAINERNKQWEAAPKIFQFKDAGPNCVAVGSSPRFKVHEVEFGWGKPEGVRSESNKRFDGVVYLYQGKSGGRSIDVEISLEAGAMERLEMDKAFLMDDYDWEDSGKYLL